MMLVNNTIACKQCSETYLMSHVRSACTALTATVVSLVTGSSEMKYSQDK